MEQLLKVGELEGKVAAEEGNFFVTYINKATFSVSFTHATFLP
jgi:hypothetical protein